MIVTLLITIGAPLAIISFIIYSDKFKEPLDLIIKTFFLGIFLCIPAGVLNDLLNPIPRSVLLCRAYGRESKISCFIFLH